MELQKLKSVMEHRWLLETMQEESEPEEETEERRTGGQEEEEERDVQIEGDLETHKAMAEEESKDDEDVTPLRVMRPRRLSRSLSLTESFSEMPSSSHRQEEPESFSESDPFSSEDLSDVAATSRQARLGKEKWSTSKELRVKVSKVGWKKCDPQVFAVRKPPLQRKGGRKRKKKLFLNKEPFPQWLKDVMINIEEATTHQLVIEYNSSQGAQMA